MNRSFSSNISQQPALKSRRESVVSTHKEVGTIKGSYVSFKRIFTLTVSPVALLEALNTCPYVPQPMEDVILYLSIVYFLGSLKFFVFANTNGQTVKEVINNCGFNGLIR
jgi:hypothetical protein